MDSDLENQSLVEAPSEPSPTDLAPGTIIGDSFEIIQFIGHGATSNVWKARQISLDRPVALKILKRRLETATEDYKCIRNEAQSLRRLSHPNIISIYGMGEWNERFYLAVDYIDGQTLQAEIAARGRLPVDRCLAIAQQCLEALAHAHAQGIVHRDIKPGNIMLTRDAAGQEVVKLVDFGIAKLFEQQLDGQVTAHTQLICGSPYYMSPEQCMGRKLDQRSDIYSLACVVHEMLTGKPAFDAETAIATMMMHASEPFPLIDRQLNVPSAVQVAILRAAAKNRDERLQTAREFIDALNDTTSGVVAAGQTAPVRRRSPWKGTVIAGGLSVLAAGLGIAVFHQLGPPNEDQYARMSRDVSSGRTSIDDEIKRIRSLSDKNLAAHEYVDLIDVVSKLNAQGYVPKLGQVALSAAEFMSQVPGADEQMAMRAKIEPVRTMLDHAFQQADDARNRQNYNELNLLLAAYMGIADGHALPTDRQVELGRMGYSISAVDPEHALRLITLALAWSEAAHNQTATAINCRFMGSCYLARGNQEEADKYFARAAAESPPNSHVKATALFLVAVRAHQTQNLKKGKDYYDRGLAILNSAPFSNITSLQEALGSAAAASVYFGTREQRYAALKKALRTLPPGVMPEGYADISTMLADAYFENQDLPNGMSALESGIQLVRQHANDSTWRGPTSRLQIHRADLLRVEHRWLEALKLTLAARQNLQIAAPSDKYNASVADSIAAACQIQLGQPAQARKSLHTAIDEANQVEDPALRAALLNSLGSRCSESSLRQEAIVIFEQLTKLPDANGAIRTQAYRDLDDVLRSAHRFAEARAACLAGQKWQREHTPASDADAVDCYWEYKLAELEQLMGHFNLAAQHMERSIELQRRLPPDAPRSNALLADRLAMWAIFLAQDKQLARSQKVIDEAWQLTLDFPRVERGKLPLSAVQEWSYHRIAQYYNLTGQWRKALEIDDYLSPYLWYPENRTRRYHNGQLYILLLRKAGRNAEAQALQKHYAGAGPVEQ